MSTRIGVPVRDSGRRERQGDVDLPRVRRRQSRHRSQSLSPRLRGALAPRARPEGEPVMSTARVTVVQGDRRFDLDLPEHLLAGKTPEQIAEAVYCGVDEPQMFAAITDGSGALSRAVAEAVLPRRELRQIGDMRGFMTGDVVQFGDTALTCASVGWTVQS